MDVASDRSACGAWEHVRRGLDARASVSVRRAGVGDLGARRNVNAKMVILFWCAASFVAYVYAGYPLTLWVWARLRPRALASVGRAPKGVTIVLAVRNERDRLRARIDNLLQLDYPSSARQIVVVSDGSDDQPESVVAPYGGLVD